VLFMAVMLGTPIPLKPVHILWVNLLTDSLPALALSMEPPPPDIMAKKPRPKGESIFAHGLWRRIALQGILIGLLTLMAFEWGLQKDDVAAARTMAFTTLIMAQLFQALNARAESSLFKVGLWSNKYMLYAIASSLVLMFAVVVTPLKIYFGVKVLSIVDWVVALVLSLLVFLITEISKYIRKI